MPLFQIFLYVTNTPCDLIESEQRGTREVPSVPWVPCHTTVFAPAWIGESSRKDTNSANRSTSAMVRFWPRRHAEIAREVLGPKNSRACSETQEISLSRRYWRMSRLVSYEYIVNISSMWDARKSAKDWVWASGEASRKAPYVVTARGAAGAWTGTWAGAWARAAGLSRNRCWWLSPWVSSSECHASASASPNWHITASGSRERNTFSIMRCMTLWSV